MTGSLIVLGLWAIATPVVALVTDRYERRIARLTGLRNTDNRSLSPDFTRERD